MEAPPLPKKKQAVFHHPLGFELYDGLAMDLHAMTYAEPMMKEIDRLQGEVAMLRTGDTCARMCEGTAYRIDAQNLRHENAKLARVLRAAVELVCAPAWSGVSDEDCELERVLRECGYMTPNAVFGVSARKGREMQTDLLLKIVKIAETWAVVPRAEGVLPDDKFVDDLQFDSLDQIEMVMECEREFAVEISDEEAERVVTVTDAAVLVGLKLTPNVEIKGRGV